VIDSQVVKTTRVGGPERGYDGAKRLAGRKRHILVDTNGLVLAAKVHGADLPDRDGGRRLPSEGSGLAEARAAVGRRSVHGRIPRVVTASVWVARGGATPPRPAVVALRVRAEATWLSAVTSPLGRGAHLRLAWSVATSEQGLRAPAADGGGDDLRGDAPALMLRRLARVA
jgi:Transposase DDE domain